MWVYPCIVSTSVILCCGNSIFTKKFSLYATLSGFIIIKLVKVYYFAFNQVTKYVYKYALVATLIKTHGSELCGQV